MPRVFTDCVKLGLVGDERQPNVIRLSPVVLYNTFVEIGKAFAILEIALGKEEEFVRSGKGGKKIIEHDSVGASVAD